MPACNTNPGFRGLGATQPPDYSELRPGYPGYPYRYDHDNKYDIEYEYEDPSHQQRCLSPGLVADLRNLLDEVPDQSSRAPLQPPLPTRCLSLGLVADLQNTVDEVPDQSSRAPLQPSRAPQQPPLPTRFLTRRQQRPVPEAPECEQQWRALQSAKRRFGGSDDSFPKHLQAFGGSDDNFMTLPGNPYQERKNAEQQERNFNYSFEHTKPQQQERHFNYSLEHTEPQQQERDFNYSFERMEPQQQERNFNYSFEHTEPQQQERNLNYSFERMEPQQQERNFNYSFEHTKPQQSQQKIQVDLTHEELGHTIADPGSALALKFEVDGIVTLMIRNLPLRYTQTELAKHIDSSGYSNLYDFLYMPSVFASGVGKGYAFVNFISSAVAASFVTAWHNTRLAGTLIKADTFVPAARIQGRDANYSTKAVLNVSAARIQGRDANLAKLDGGVTSRIRNPHYRPVIKSSAECLPPDSEQARRACSKEVPQRPTAGPEALGALSAEQWQQSTAPWTPKQAPQSVDDRSFMEPAYIPSQKQDVYRTPPGLLRSGDSFFCSETNLPSTSHAHAHYQRW